MELFNLLQNETRKLQLPKYDIADVAPSTLIETVSHYKQTGRILVWGGASESTIWTPQGNYMFRAWHDYCHVLSHGTFDHQGESIVCKLQQSQVESSFMQRVLQIEIMGQLSYFETNNQFPVNQIEFFINQLKGA